MLACLKASPSGLTLRPAKCFWVMFNPEFERPYFTHTPAGGLALPGFPGSSATVIIAHSKPVYR